MTFSDQSAPVSDYDLYADASLLDPYAGYNALREKAGAVALSKYEGYAALTRYHSLKKVLNDDVNFPSGFGVMMNDPMNEVLRGNTLCSDGDHHNNLRKVTAAPMTPGALKALEEDIRVEAEALADRLTEQGSFDAIDDLAQYLPVKIVSSAVGLPEAGREKMLVWSEAIFNCIGPMNKRTEEAMPVLEEMVGYAQTQAVRGKLRPGSWAETILDAADRGEVPQEAVPVLMIDYMAPSLDTTILAIGSAVYRFAQSPDQWDKLREDPSLVRNALNEVLRLESPIQGFGRYVANDVEVDGVTLPEGSRVICLYGAGNRDPREFENPDVFDVTRRNANLHLAFGGGPHQCLGMNLARLEMTTLFSVLIQKVKRFHIKEEERMLNNVLRGFKHLKVRVET